MYVVDRNDKSICLTPGTRLTLNNMLNIKLGEGEKSSIRIVA